MTTLYMCALQELGGVFDALNDSDVDKALQMVADAKKIALAVAVSGQIMGFAMRLYHMALMLRSKVT